MKKSNQSPRCVVGCVMGNKLSCVVGSLLFVSLRTNLCRGESPICEPANKLVSWGVSYLWACEQTGTPHFSCIVKRKMPAKSKWAWCCVVGSLLFVSLRTNRDSPLFLYRGKKDAAVSWRERCCCIVGIKMLLCRGESPICEPANK